MQKVAEVTSEPALSATSRPAVEIWLFLLLVVISALGIYRHSPPSAVRADAPDAEFSSGRAMEHVRMIAQNPHPIGSPEQKMTRDYLIGELNSLGLTTEVQRDSSINQRRGIIYVGGMVENIVARLEGTGGSKAIVIMAHYDSVPTGPGASDDASGVATILETVRALKQGPPLNNDVIVLLTDGEEVGLLGARAFVNGHRWARDVGLVLNFEARGNSGPVVMFETTEGNRWMINEFAKSAPHPVSNSFMYEIYKTMPNDTDMTEFKRAGIPGLNFGYVYGSGRYHTLTDSLESIDERSIQHQGSYALALTRHFGNLSLDNNLQSGDATYFDVLGWAVIRYPASWVKPLTFIVALIFITALVMGFIRKELTVKGVATGFIALLASMILTGLALFLVWWIVRSIHSQYGSIYGDIYNSTPYLVSFAALTITLVYLLFGWLKNKTSSQNLWTGALCWWLVLTVLTGLFLPGSNYLFLWPLLFSTLAFCYLHLFSREGRNTTGRFVVLSISLLVGVVLFVPFIVLMFFTLSVKGSPVVMAFSVLLLGLLMPHLIPSSPARKRLLPSFMLVVCIGFLITGSLTAGLGKDQPRQNHLFYGLNADSGKAMWASADETPDEWTNKFLSGSSERITLPEYFPQSPRLFLAKETVAEPLPAPEATLLKEDTQGDIRTLRLRIASRRQASVVSVYVSPDADVKGLLINGQRMEYSGPVTQGGRQIPLQLHYYATPQEGIEITLEARSLQQIDVRVVDQSYGLTGITNSPFEQRPDYMVAAPIPFSNMMLVSKNFSF